MRRAPFAIDWRALVVVFAPPLLILVVLAVTAQVRHLDTGAIFRDPASLTDSYPLLGAMSNVGIVLWWLAVGICLFTWSLGRRFGVERRVGVFLLTAGLLTMVLAIDDQFMLHDDLLSEWFGLRERHIMAGYLLLAGAWLLLNRKVIRGSEWQLLAVALFFFTGSVALDAYDQAVMTDAAELGQGLDWGLFVEDGVKFVGIFGWAAYLVRFSHGTVVQLIAPAEEHHSP